MSIVMPVWRPRPDWLRAAVAGALAERCEIELVVVDDGNEPALGAGLPDDPRLRLVRIRHGGQSAARNAGIAAARGTHVRFVDCDDVVVPGGTSHLLALGGADARIAYGATEICNEELEPLRTIRCELQGRAEDACVRGSFPVYGPAMLFPRRVVEAAGPWDETFDVMADWEWVLRALAHAPVVGDRTVVYRYRQHAESIQGRTTHDDAEAAHHRIVAGYLGRHELGRRQARKLAADAHLRYARTHLRERRLGRSLGSLARGARLDPLGGGRVAVELAAREARRARDRLRRGR